MAAFEDLHALVNEESIVEAGLLSSVLNINVKSIEIEDMSKAGE